MPASRASAAGTPWAIGPAVMICSTVRRGFSDANGSWKIIWMRLRPSRSAAPFSAV